MIFISQQYFFTSHIDFSSFHGIIALR